MRAIFNRESDLGEQILLTAKEDLHHLLNVLRVKAGEELLIMDGTGKVGTYHIQHITKQKVELKRISFEIRNREHRISLLLGTPKKEYLEEVIRSSVQLGVNEIFLWESDYSQTKNTIKPERLEKILKSCYEQSNNPFELKIKKYSELDLDFFDYRFVMTVQKESDESDESKEENDKKFDFKDLNLKLPTLIAVGPEGGFSQDELKSLKDKEFVPLHLPTPILKTIEAVPAGIGALFGASSMV